MPRLLTVLAALALIGLSGCGESDQEQAREVVQDFVDARADNDAEAECDLYSESYLEELAVGDNCAAFVEEQSSGAGPQELEIVEVRVKDDEATADIDIERPEEGVGPARISLLLTREDDDWKIAGFQ